MDVMIWIGLHFSSRISQMLRHITVQMPFSGKFFNCINVSDERKPYFPPLFNASSFVGILDLNNSSVIRLSRLFIFTSRDFQRCNTPGIEICLQPDFYLVISIWWRWKTFMDQCYDKYLNPIKCFIFNVQFFSSAILSFLENSLMRSPCPFMTKVDVLVICTYSLYCTYV